MNDVGVPDLLIQCLNAYWHEDFGTSAIDARERMAAVLKLVAQSIDGWAPNEYKDRMTHKAIAEIAERLRFIASAHGVPRAPIYSGSKGQNSLTN